MPSESYVGDQLEVVRPNAVHEARRRVRGHLGRELRDLWLQVYDRDHDEGPYRFESADVARRSRKNVCLAYLMAAEDPEGQARCAAQFRAAANMTDVLAALGALVHEGHAESSAALAEFYDRWRDDPLVLDKWFAIQAGAPRPDTLVRVEELLGHEAFSLKNPNKVRA